MFSGGGPGTLITRRALAKTAPSQSNHTSRYQAHDSLTRTQTVFEEAKQAQVGSL